MNQIIDYTVSEAAVLLGHQLNVKLKHGAECQTVQR